MTTPLNAVPSPLVLPLSLRPQPPASLTPSSVLCLLLSTSSSPLVCNPPLWILSRLPLPEDASSPPASPTSGSSSWLLSTPPEPSEFQTSSSKTSTPTTPNFAHASNTLSPSPTCSDPALPPLPPSCNPAPRPALLLPPDYNNLVFSNKFSFPFSCCFYNLSKILS